MTDNVTISDKVWFLNALTDEEMNDFIIKLEPGLKRIMIAYLVDKGLLEIAEKN